jgi:hypothetical protein
MPYHLSEDEQLIRRTVAEFARDVVTLDGAHERDRHDRFPTDILQQAAQLGLTAMSLTAEEGGAGVTPTAFAAATIEIARVDPAFAAILAAHNGMAVRLLRHGGDGVRQQALAKLAAGEAGCYLATEEAGGSDKSRLTTEAIEREDGAGFRLTGRKTWGLGAAGARHFVVLAAAEAGPTLFYVPADAAGVSLGKNEPLLGLRAAGIRTVYFDDVRLPAEARIGAAGEGQALYEAALPWLQVGVAAAIVGAIRGAFVAARDFAQSRVQFGEPIGKYQAVSDSVTAIDVQVAAAEALVLEAAGRLDGEAKEAAAHAARAKAFTADVSAALTRLAIRIQGGTGFMREGGTERFARDVRCLWFVGETPHMQRDLLKRHLLDIDFGPTP